MKIRVVILKKRQIILSLIIILFIILTFSLISYFMKNSTTEAITLINDNKVIKEDLNGDGSKDTLYINNKDNKYYMEISTGSEVQHISCNKKLDTLGSFNPYWPMRLEIKDISRNRTPEIFIQSSENSLPVQHVFTYNNNKFNDIFCSNGNFLGFLDSNNSRTPKFLSGDIKNGTLDIGYYILNNNELKNYSFDKTVFPGAKSIVDFVSYMESLPYGEEFKPDVFYDGLSGNALYAIGKISAECSEVTFLDGYFVDTAWGNAGNILGLECFFNFKGSLKDSTNFTAYSLKVILKPDPTCNNEFKIYSITI